MAWIEGELERAKELGEETRARCRGSGTTSHRLGADRPREPSPCTPRITAGGEATRGEPRALPRGRIQGGRALLVEPARCRGVSRRRARAGDGVLRESLERHRDLGDRWRTASVLEALAEVLAPGAARSRRRVCSAPARPSTRPSPPPCHFANAPTTRRASPPRAPN